MTTAAGCTSNRLILKPKEGGKRKVFRRIANGEEQRYGVPTRARCHDCGVLDGKFHHPGCDWEECPCCRHQLISCSCNDRAYVQEGAPYDADYRRWMEEDDECDPPDR